MAVFVWDDITEPVIWPQKWSARIGLQTPGILWGHFVNRQVSVLHILFIMFVSATRSCKGSPCLQSSSDYRAQLLYQELSITVESKAGIPSYTTVSLETFTLYSFLQFIQSIHFVLSWLFHC